ncbi:MAG: putative selenate reductase subunit YgfK [Anaerolineaceae bacterium]|nr:putative selenate reductase subunit YgfK [Anaerolineaceae bacterium]
MGDRMHPMSFGELMTRICKGYAKTGQLLGVDPVSLAGRKAIPLFGGKIETPFGPAAGPNTQLAGNLVAAYAAGARFFELKTVQKMDGEELAVCVPRPCILAYDEGYNVEWSTELTITDAASEYIRGWWAIKLLSKELDLGDPDGFIFNMSVGYDLAGIKLPKVDNFINSLIDASGTETWKECLDWTLAHLDQFKKVDEAYVRGISPKISNNVTISTLHGCPPDEIERIAVHLITEKKLNTFVKCNPTLLGYDFVRKTLDDLGFTSIQFPDLHYREDLQWADAVPMFKRLKQLAAETGVAFGLKLTNTKPVDITGGFLPGQEAYMSGRSLFPLSINLAAKIAREFNGELPLSFAGGADAWNIGEIYGSGIYPVTMATNILKPGGYQRMTQLIDIVGPDMPSAKIDVERLSALAEDAKSNKHYQGLIKKTPRRKISGKPPLFDCFTPPCAYICPIHQDIPAYLKALAQGDAKKAAEIIIEKNPLPNITGTICPHTCMDSCNRNQYEGAVGIRSCKLEAAEKGLDAVLAELKPAAKIGKSAAIVGGGPAGMAAAYFLAKNGWHVDLYEKEKALGGIVRNVIPGFRISDAAIEKDADLIRKLGVNIHLETKVDDIKALCKEKDAVILAVGANKSTKLELEHGDSLNAIQFMYDLKAGKKIDLGKHVAVVGAGNTAMDAARAAKRVEGVEDVSIVYRRDIANMPADLIELQEAMEDGVIFRPLLAPVTLENGRLVCEVMKLGEPDVSGRRKPVPTGEKCEIPCDTVIASLGEKVDGEFYKSLGLELDERGLPIEKDNIQIIGDGLSGPKTVVLAIASAAKAVYDICGPDYWKYTPLNFEYAGLSKRAVLKPVFKEADPTRCLECGGLCGMCVESCPNRCNEYLEVNGKKQVIHIDCLCNECGNCAVFCPYDGHPFRDKITVFSDRASLDDSTNQGFANLGGGRYAIRWNDQVCECALEEIPADLQEVVKAYEA